MACKTSFELHHHFPRLAEESGFTFNTHRPRVHIDWNKIRIIDLDSLIRERNFSVIEQHLNDILDCVLESEFDVRILDEGVMKMFRLAQLAVEYQQFCRHYLDRSVYVLKEEISVLAQELDKCKKELRDKDDELRKLRKRSRQTYKTPLPYGNDNIANMILKTLTQKNDLFPSTSNDNLHYNKCNYCDKVFLNQLYLKSHISRRHANVMESPQKEIPTNNENTRLSAEISELKNKLKEMEIMITNTNNLHKQTSETVDNNVNKINNSTENTEDIIKEMKDTGVSTNNDDYLLNRIEEWKRQEHENYNNEISKLRNQIMESINTLKEQGTQKPIINEYNTIEQLHLTIKQQGSEIVALKQELTNSRLKTEQDIADRNKEAETQIAIWVKRAEEQSKQYDQLLQKLNDVAKDAKESRALAIAETQRAEQLQILLQESINAKSAEDVNRKNEVLVSNNKPLASHSQYNPIEKKDSKKRTDEGNDNKTLEMLQRKAQELLSFGSASSTSSDLSSTNLVKPFQIETLQLNEKQRKNEFMKPNHVPNSKTPDAEIMLSKKKKRKKEKSKTRNKSIEQAKVSVLPGSPMKLVRSKLTEEVNNRLISAGVDPLRSRLPRGVFQKKRTLLQQQLELKTKKNPTHEKVRHSILAYLDSSMTNINKTVTHSHEYVSPNKATKPFHNLSSMLSNVKTKALSLVKLNDTNAKSKQKSLDTDVAKRALAILKTPPGSSQTSPLNMRHSPLVTNSNITQNSTHVSNIKAQSQHNHRLENDKKVNKYPFNTMLTENRTDSDSDDSGESEHKYYSSTQQSSKSVENLIKSPARRPLSATTNYKNNVNKCTISSNNLLRTQSATNLTERDPNTDTVIPISNNKNSSKSSDGLQALTENQTKKDFASNKIIHTKGVLKNASSISSLNKKKVLFDMEAIQMKSVSASPSQSITDKSDGNEKYDLGLVQLEGEEWDISSIENEPLKNDTKIQNVITRTSPKIAELREKIESQLARRNETPTVTLAGKVDVLAGPMIKANSIGGSNTSLGSSILDDSDSAPAANHKAFIKPKKISVKDDSDIDISDFSIDGIVNKTESF